jgi:hypothetical protein
VIIMLIVPWLLEKEMRLQIKKPHLIRC